MDAMGFTIAVTVAFILGAVSATLTIIFCSICDDSKENRAKLKEKDRGQKFLRIPSDKVEEWRKDNPDAEVFSLSAIDGSFYVLYEEE